MAAHTRVWSNTDPQGSVFSNTLDTELQNFRTDVDERQKLEHYWLSSQDDTALTADGRHKAGIAGVLGSGATGSIPIDSTLPGEGAMYHDTTFGVTYRWDIATTTWIPWIAHSDKTLFRVTLSSGYVNGIGTSDASFTKVQWEENGTIDVDLGSAFGTPASKTVDTYEVPVTGYYVFPGQVGFDNSTAGTQYHVALYKTSATSGNRLLYSKDLSQSLADTTITIPAVPFLLTAGTKVFVAVGSSRAVSLLAATAETVWSGYLLQATVDV